MEAESGQKENGYQQIYEACVNSNIPVFSMHAAFHSAIQEGMDPYRPNDTIHPNKIGQKLIAAEIRKNIPNEAILRNQ